MKHSLEFARSAYFAIVHVALWILGFTLFAVAIGHLTGSLDTDTVAPVNQIALDTEEVAPAKSCTPPDSSERSIELRTNPEDPDTQFIKSPDGQYLGSIFYKDVDLAKILGYSISVVVQSDHFIGLISDIDVTESGNFRRTFDSVDCMVEFIHSGHIVY